MTCVKQEPSVYNTTIYYAEDGSYPTDSDLVFEEGAKSIATNGIRVVNITAICQAVCSLICVPVTNHSSHSMYPVMWPLRTTPS